MLNGYKFRMRWHVVKKLFFDMLSFNTPFARVLNFLIVFFLAALVPTDRLYILPVRSVYKEVFGLESYSSGLTRAMSRLFHGDLYGALAFNKLVIPVTLLMIVLLGLNGWKVVREYKKTRRLF